MSPAHALTVAGATDRQIEAFYTEARNTDERTMRAMIDNPSGWLAERRKAEADHPGKCLACLGPLGDCCCCGGSVEMVPRTPRVVFDLARATPQEVDAFYAEARDADETRMREMIDNPSAWLAARRAEEEAWQEPVPRRGSRGISGRSPVPRRHAPRTHPPREPCVLRRPGPTLVQTRCRTRGEARPGRQLERLRRGRDRHVPLQPQDRTGDTSPARRHIHEVRGRRTGRAVLRMADRLCRQDVAQPRSRIVTTPVCPLDGTPITSCPCPPMFRDATYCPDCPLRAEGSSS